LEKELILILKWDAWISSRTSVVVVNVVIAVTTATTTTYKDWTFCPVPVPGLVKLVLPSLQQLSSQPSSFQVIIK
jgi:hypothetical protein